MRNRQYLNWLAAFTLGSAGVAYAADAPARLELRPCRISHVENEVKCATYEVFENRDSRQGRKISLNIVVLPATARIKETDAIFLFAGGPGQAATDFGRQALGIFGGLNSKRDIVLVDQRGTGKSNGLFCRMPKAGDPGMNEVAKRDVIARKFLAECRAELSRRADLSLYTTTIAMADIDDVRAALGYDKIDLWGGSYGTRAALEYLRRYPAHVRSVVIDGVAPPSMALPLGFGRDAGASYEKMLVACEKEKTCNEQYPSLRAEVNAMLDELGKKPRKVSIADALTGKVREMEISRDIVLISIFTSLYVPELSAMMPGLLMDARHGNFGPLLSQGSLFGDGGDDKMAYGMRLSVVCAEDLPRIGEDAAKAEAAHAPFGRLFIDEFRKGCENWPRGKVPDDFSNPVQSSVPALIFSGAQDPVTPPAQGEEVKKSLANSVHLVAPNIGHGISGHGCAPRLIKRFIESASVAGIDGECLHRLPRPLFPLPMRDREDKRDDKTTGAGHD